MAANCSTPPAKIVGFCGVRSRDTRTGGPTERRADPLTPPKTAEIEVVPWEIPVAKPPAPTEATEGDAELQVAKAVRFCVVPSLRRPVATNCCVVPLGKEGFDGVTSIELSSSCEVRVAEPCTPPEEAVMVATPGAKSRATP